MVAPYTSFVNVYLQLSNVHSLMIRTDMFLLNFHVAAIGPKKDIVEDLKDTFGDFYFRELGMVP